MSAFEFDIDKLPPLLRISDIVRDPRRNYPGLLPITRSSFLDAVRDGFIPPPVKLGGKAVAWKREDIVRIIREGVKSRRKIARERRAAAQAQANL
jgi:prophage regulatory protein